MPPFLKQSKKPVDLGPLSEFPLSQWVIATFMLAPPEGGREVSRRTAYIRYNGLLKGQPSFTIISNRCAHLGCPVQPLGLVQQDQAKTAQTTGGEVVTTIPVIGVSGFGCPCHGGPYDTEGNRTAGPPVRGLDRYEFSIQNGHLILGRNYSVSHVDGTGAQARIHKYDLAGPGQHVDGWEQIFYPIQPPAPPPPFNNPPLLFPKKTDGRPSHVPAEADGGDRPLPARLARGAVGPRRRGQVLPLPQGPGRHRTGSTRSARRR